MPKLRLAFFGIVLWNSGEVGNIWRDVGFGFCENKLASKAWVYKLVFFEFINIINNCSSMGILLIFFITADLLVLMKFSKKNVSTRSILVCTKSFAGL